MPVKYRIDGTCWVSSIRSCWRRWISISGSRLVPGGQRGPAASRPSGRRLRRPHAAREPETAKLEGFCKAVRHRLHHLEPRRSSPELLDIALEARPRAVMLSFGDPAPFASRIKADGALLICQVQSEDLAKQAPDCGADILIAQGTEAGGHGASRTTIDIVPAIVDFAAGRVPVVAAGGIADGRGPGGDVDARSVGRADGHAPRCQHRGRRGR